MSNRMFFIKGLVFIVLLTIIFYSLSIIFDLILRNSMNNKTSWMINKKNEYYDIAFLGASDAYRGLDFTNTTSEINNKYINMSQAGTAFYEQYLVLKLFLRKNHVNYLILVVNAIALDTTWFSYPFHEYKFMPFLNDPVVFEGLKELYGFKVYAWKYIPLYKYSIFNQNIGIISAMKALFLKKCNYDKWGSSLLNDTFDDSEWQKLEKIKLSIHNKRAINFLKILGLAKKNKVKVIMVSFPVYYKISEKLINFSDIHDYYLSNAEQYKIPYISFLNDSMCHKEECFANYGHVNAKGARVFTKKLFNELYKMKIINY